MPDSAKKEIKTVVVFCGSKFGNSPEYQRDAEALGRLLGQNGFDLVYGGGTAGLMGVVSRTAHENGSKVTGVITEAFRKAVNYNFLDGADEQIVRTLPSRKARMLKQADACIILAGGIGTQDEQWEAAALIDMQIAGKSKSFLKPVIVLNTNGIYDDLKSQMRKLIAEGFIHPGREKLIRSVDSPEEVIQKLQKWNSEGVLRACEVANTNAPPVQKPQVLKIG
ncbi:MAG: LOG family protein [Micavibrio sp.]